MLVAVLAGAAAPAAAGGDRVTAGPANDDFADATELPGTDGTLATSTVAATKEEAEPDHAGSPGGASTWFRWVAPASGPATIDTAGSTFNTLVAVYTGAAVGGLAPIAANDNAVGTGRVLSAVAFTAAAGTAYRVAVDGAGGATGDVVLRWSGAAAPQAIVVTSPNGGERAPRGVTRTIRYTVGAPPLLTGLGAGSTGTVAARAGPSPRAAVTGPTRAAAGMRAPSVVGLDTASTVAAGAGSARVIVTLAAPFRPEGDLAPAGVAAQRAGITADRHTLLGRLRGTDHAVVRSYDTLPLLALRLDPGAVERLRRAPEVAAVAIDGRDAPTLTESTPLVEAPAAHAAGFDGTGTAVAVLDTGVDAAHPFLAGKVAAEACFSATSHCPGGAATVTGPGSAVPCTYAAGACRHGTHVAGIAAGSGTGTNGVARGASVLAVQVFSRFTGPDCAGGEDPCALAYISDQIAAMEHVYALRTSHAFASVNLSLGGGTNSTHCDGDPRKSVIDQLRSVGIATVAAAGNAAATAAMMAPACISSAISVGSSTKADGVSSFSNSASFLSLLAPGSTITSAIPGGAFTSFSGTSMATPHVSGAWAVLRQFRPGAPVGDVLAALQATGRPILDSRNGITTPRIRVQRAMVALDPRLLIEVLRAGVAVSTLAADVAPPAGGGGSFDWAVPSGLALGDDYAIRVSSVPDPRATDTSDAWFSVTPGPPGTHGSVADFDGDGDTDRAVYRSGAWFTDAQATTFHGLAADVPVAADYDGVDGTDRAVWRDGAWLTEAGPTVFLGLPGDVPVPGDYDGDGGADRAVWRPVDGAWHVEGRATTYLGLAGDIPVPGDYDGDGDTERAVYRPAGGAWFVEGEVTVHLGLAGDVPVPGDFDGDGDTDPAVYRPTVGGWFRSGRPPVFVGLSGDVPVPGDYDADGSADPAVFRPGAGGWYVAGAATVFLGLDGDIPVALPQAVYRRFY